jgi:hypothetical protein
MIIFVVRNSTNATATIEQFSRQYLLFSLDRHLVGRKLSILLHLTTIPHHQLVNCSAPRILCSHCNIFSIAENCCAGSAALPAIWLIHLVPVPQLKEFVFFPLYFSIASIHKGIETIWLQHEDGPVGVA